MKTSKKTGGKVAISAKTGKAGIKKPLNSVLLYSFQNGTLTTCEFPSLKLEVHRTKFLGHRCGYSKGRFYFLEEYDWLNWSKDPLRTSAKLKIYNPTTKKIEKEIDTCACSFGSEVPLLMKSGFLVDLGLDTRMINASNGERSIFPSLHCFEDVFNFAACDLSGKKIYIAGGYDSELLNQRDDDQDLQGNVIKLPLEEVMRSDIYVIDYHDFSWSKLKVRIVPPLYRVSLVSLSADELLLLGEDEISTVAYRLRGNSLIKEGGSKRSLGRCCSSAIQDGVLFMFFDSGCVGKCSLKTGLMRVYDLGAFSRWKAALWTIERTAFRRLSEGMLRMIYSWY